MAENRQDIKVRVIHAGTLFFGVLIGLTAAYYFNLIPFDFSKELAKANALGIESRTVLQGYPKTKDLITYATVLGFPIICALTFWLLIAKRLHGRDLADMLKSSKPALDSRDKKWMICLGLVSVLLLYLAFDVNNFYKSRHNMFVGDWPFLGEEG